jgi:hypothetical protein
MGGVRANPLSSTGAARNATEETTIVPIAAASASRRMRGRLEGVDRTPEKMSDAPRPREPAGGFEPPHPVPARSTGIVCV